MIFWKRPCARTTRGLLGLSAGAALCAGLVVGGDGADSGNLLVTGARTFNVPVVSMAESGFQTVVRQEYDFSCGAAAVATLLTHHYGYPTPEKKVFEGMIRMGDKEKIEREGFSMLEMKAYLASLGVKSQGFEADTGQMAEVGLPGIVLVNINGYMHFVVVKGISKREVLVGDPALGIKNYDRQEFDQLRVSNVALYIADAIEQGTEAFNKAEEWALIGRAPLTASVRHDQLMGTQILNLPAPNEF